MAHPTIDVPTERTDAFSERAPRWAWGLCWLMFACTVLNYMDRQAIAVVGPQVKEEFGLDNVGFGWVLAAFQLTYAFFQWPAGFLVDRWDLRRTYATAVAWWSLAGLATAFAPALGVLVLFRALLGVGESFNWPCALRVTAGILPPADRSLGNGIFNSGAAVGAVLTPLLVVPLAVALGWRAPFLVLGLAGLCWVVIWLVFSRRLDGFPKTSTGGAGGATQLAPLAVESFGLVAIAAFVVALTAIRFGPPSILWGVAVLMVGLLVVARALPLEQLQGAEWARSLGVIVRERRFWVMVAVGVTINVTWHFLVSWMGMFFQDGRKLGILIGGMVIAVPFLAADGGNLLGGALTRSLAGRGWSTTAARKLVLGACMVLISSAVWVGFLVATDPRTVGQATGLGTGSVLGDLLAAIRSDGLVIGLLSLTALGTAAYMVNFFAFAQDVAPRHTGLVIGYLGGLGNLCAAGFMPLAGSISQGRWGYAPNFIIVGLLPLIGFLTLLLAWGQESNGSVSEAV